MARKTEKEGGCVRGGRPLALQPPSNWARRCETEKGEEEEEERRTALGFFVCIVCFSSFGLWPHFCTQKKNQLMDVVLGMCSE